MADAKFTIDVNGLDALQRKLAVMVGKETLASPIQKALDLVRDRMAAYPPEPVGSTYQRTFELHDSWKTYPGLIGNVAQFGGTVENDATSPMGVHYAALVQHDPMLGMPSQVDIHRGLWQTDQEVLDDLQPQISELFHNAMVDSWGGRDLSGSGS